MYVCSLPTVSSILQFFLGSFVYVERTAHLNCNANSISNIHLYRQLMVLFENGRMQETAASKLTSLTFVVTSLTQQQQYQRRRR